MQYDFLIGHRVRIDKLKREGEKREKVKEFESYEGFVMRVIEFVDYEKIIVVKNDGLVRWFKKHKKCVSDGENKDISIIILDWDPDELLKKDNNKKKNRFELMDI